MLWVEPGQSRIGWLASVAPVLPVDREYTFAVPDEMVEQLTPGQRIMVPIGRTDRLVSAFCLTLAQGPWTSTLKSVDSLCDPISFLDNRLLELGRWIARHYAHPLGRTLAALVPTAVQERRGFATVQWARLAVPLDEIAQAHRLGPKQRLLLERLAVGGMETEIKPVLAATGASAATLRRMVNRGWIEIIKRRVPRPAPDFDLPLQEPDFELNDEQQQAVRSVFGMIDRGRFGVELLFGVSGCGKTEVYVRAMQRVVAAGRQVLLLVPEIALTTQLVGRLVCRFKQVAVLHSGLSEVDRSLTWNEIRAGRKRVVIGTRSAVFAPCRELGLIVVDEEQETSYKNLQAPRYHVRDVAIKRGQLENLPVLLGSATPSLETWVNCGRRAHFRLTEITHRVRGLPMPEVRVVDMRDEAEVQGRLPMLSRLMEQELARTLASGDQAVVLMNRRGFSSWLFCRRCKQRIECRRCNTSMVYHSARGVMLCHYCGRREPVPGQCPDPACRSKLVSYGAGTQRVEQILRQRFTDQRVTRVDSDTMRRAADYAKVIGDFEARRIDVLIGTQMIAKGLDFPHVSFVGVINGDAVAAASDFRAGERLFQLMTQVAGRAGRKMKQGLVVVQTTNPDSPALQAAIRHDYRAFAQAEITKRRSIDKLGYPPHTRLVRIILAHAREEQTRTEAAALTDRVRQAIEQLALPATDLIGPQPCVLSRLRGLYRYDVLLRSQSPDRLEALLTHLRADGALRARVKTVTIDVDPVALA